MASKEVASHSLPPSSESHYNEEDDEEASDSKEDEDLREYGLGPSLPTTATPAEGFADSGDDDNEIIVDESEGFSAALRYLASVRLEAKTVPQVVVAEQHPRKAADGEREREGEEATADRTLSFHSSPPTSSPSDAVSLADPWLQPFLDDFAELRGEITRVREIEHRDAWRLGAVEGKKKQKKTEGEEEEEQQLPRSWRAALGLFSRKEGRETPEEQQQKQPRSPSSRFLASLPQPEVVDALESVAEAVREFLEEEEEEGDESSAGVIIITPAVALWTFSLAANLERPVPPHASAALSALGKAAGAEAKMMRRRRRRRRRRRGEKKEEEEEKGAAAAAEEDTDRASPPPPPPLAASSPCPHAAVVAAVCGAYFVQCEELSRAAREGWP